MAVLPRSFYLRPDTVLIARELLGMQLFTRIEGLTTSGIICETEAYEGTTDKASHAFGGRRTSRTSIMYAVGGTAYIYLCYGIHSLFNVVTNNVEIPHAVLIRGIIPVHGTDIMLHRSGKLKATKDMGIGPGKAANILGIHYSHSGLDLVRQPENRQDPAIWIDDTGISIKPCMIIAGPRVGVDYAGEDALRPNRFSMRER